jgi:3-oxoacyl-[acyl-carrier protein] reductase
MAGGARALVTGSDAGFGRELAQQLADRGVELVPDGRGDGSVDGPVDMVVHADVDPVALEPRPLAATSPEDWHRRCEAVLRVAFDCARRAHGLLRPGGGLLVFVTPTVGITGAAELVPYATAIEGMRSLAKVAARQWGAVGIRVNCVAPAVELLTPAPGRLGPDVAEAALGDDRVGAAAVAGVIALLADDAVAVTGATVPVDGGVVMAP